jgi:hypothetical protein
MSEFTVDKYQHLRDTSNHSPYTLVFITLTMQGLSLFVGLLLSWLWIQEMPWYWFWTNYIIAAIFATAIHSLGHRHWSGRWFRAHTIEHHVKLYPPKRFTDKVVKVSADPNAKYYIPVMILPFIYSWYALRSLRVAVASSVEVLLWLWFVDYIHMGYHLDDFWMERYPWFMYLRKLHFRHHSGDMLTNMGIADFFVDWLTGILATGMN